MQRHLLQQALTILLIPKHPLNVIIKIENCQLPIFSVDLTICPLNPHIIIFEDVTPYKKINLYLKERLLNDYRGGQARIREVDATFGFFTFRFKFFPLQYHGRQLEPWNLRA